MKTEIQKVVVLGSTAWQMRRPRHWGSATCLSQTRLQSWLPSEQSWIYRKQILQVAWMPIRWAGTVALEAWDILKGRQAGRSPADSSWNPIAVWGRMCKGTF